VGGFNNEISARDSNKRSIYETVGEGAVGLFSSIERDMYWISIVS
jgi:hypothetical protein